MLQNLQDTMKIVIFYKGRMTEMESSGRAIRQNVLPMFSLCWLVLYETLYLIFKLSFSKLNCQIPWHMLSCYHSFSKFQILFMAGSLTFALISFFVYLRPVSLWNWIMPSAGIQEQSEKSSLREESDKKLNCSIHLAFSNGI